MPFLLANVGLMDILGALDRIGMAGLAVVGLWFLWSRLNKKLDEKDTRLAELETRLQTLQSEHAEKIETLQNTTINKIETWGNKTGKLVERCISLQADINQTMKTLNIVED